MTRLKSKEKTNEEKIEMRKQKGFSLIELLIVVAIILIIAAIAIPNLMRAKMAANDSSAAAGERTIVTAEVGYFASYPTIGYTSLVALGGAINAACVPSTTTACLIDNNLANNGPGGNGKSGYNSYCSYGHDPSPVLDHGYSARDHQRYQGVLRDG